LTVGFDIACCQVLDIGRHVQRLDIGDTANAVSVAPGEKIASRPVVSHAGVLVADGGGEKFQEPARGLVAGVDDHARHHDAVAGSDGQGPGRRYGDLLAHAVLRYHLDRFSHSVVRSLGERVVGQSVVATGAWRRNVDTRATLKLDRAYSLR
jgi:hypothetical protein